MFSLPTLVVNLYICSFIASVLLLFKVSAQYKKIEVRWLIAFTIALSIISFFAIHVYAHPSLEDKELFSRLRFVGLSILAQTWFFFIAQTYSKRKFLYNPWFIAISLLPSAVTILFAIVPTWNHLLTHNYQLIWWEGTQLVTFSNGPWFLVHLLLANLFALSSLIFAAFMIYRFRGAKQKQLIVLSIGCLASLVVDFYAVFFNPSLRWAMLSGCVFLFTELAILYAIFKQGLFDPSIIAKDRLFQNIPDPIVILDNKLRLADINKAAKDLLMISKDNLNLEYKEYPILSSINMAIPIQEVWHSNDTSKRCFKITNEQFDTKKFTCGRILLFHDITEQKNIEKQLSSNLEFKARLLSLISHDFLGILQTQTYLSTNLEKDVSPELRQQAVALANSTIASKDFMGNILSWIRTQENEFQPIRRPFELHTLIRDVIESHESLYIGRNLIVNFNPKNTSFIMTGDSVMIESIIRNLFTNAIRASQAGNQITFDVKEEEKQVKILVQDEGVGMSKKQLIRIQHNQKSFLHKDFDSSEGYGIGLTIARRFVDLHQGNLDFISEEGKGTLAILTLPLQEPSC